ncbi:transcription termination factor family protein [Medicago truncatula]|uniref:Transcription termination factor family protein n=1 Tax=Medicago truncatula TaxID=3880 RepID=A0A072U474_MEDTR|nr:transcription termination factor family protein [Medicago truncatula]
MFVKLKSLVLLHKPYAMLSLKLLRSLPLNSNSLHSFLCSFSSLSTPINQSSNEETTFLFNLLNSNSKLHKSESIYVSKLVLGITSPEKPLSVINFFKQIGFSQTQIHSIIHQRTQVLFSKVDKTLKPKVELFQQLGFQGSQLGHFLSKNPNILIASLNKTLVPSVEVIKKFVRNEKDLNRVLYKCGWILPQYRLFVANIAFLESCGIVGNQVLIILKCYSRILIEPQSRIRNYISQAEDLGFPQNSRMLVHALHTLYCLSHKTFEKKLDFIQHFGFSKDQSLRMFKHVPALLRSSEKKLKVGIEFFLHTVMLPKSTLVSQPAILMYSMEDRVFPRFRVYQLLKSQNLCQKLPSFVTVLSFSEDMFLDRFISRCKEKAEALVIAYKGHCLEILCSTCRQSVSKSTCQLFRV